MIAFSPKVTTLSKLLSTILFLVIVTTVQATTYYSPASGTNLDPTNKNNWWTGTGGSGTHPGNFTAAADVFVIQSGVSMAAAGKSWTVAGKLQVKGTFIGPTKDRQKLSFGSLTIDGGGSASTGIGTFTVTGATAITGTLTVATTKASTFGGTLTISGGTYTESVVAVPVYKGGISNSGTFTASTGLHTFSNNAQSISGTVTIPSVKINGITLTNNGNFTISTAMTEGGTSAIIQGANSTLNFGGTITLDALTASATGNTVIYSRSGTQTAFPITYYNLTLAGTSAKTTTSVTVNGTLKMDGTATASAAPAYVSSAGSVPKLQYVTTHTSGPEWPATFSATGGVIIDNPATVTIQASSPKVLACGVPITINSGATLTQGANLLTLGGNFNNFGTFTSGGTGGVTIGVTSCSSAQTIGTFSTAGAVTITGTNTQTISSFTTSGSGAAGTITMSKTGGTATLTGNMTAAALTIDGTGGTLNLGGSSLSHTISGAVTLTNGTLNGGVSTLNVAGNWSGVGNNFTAGTGTVNFNGAAQAISSSSTAPSPTFFNVTFSGTNTKTISNSFTANGLMTVGGPPIVQLANGTTSNVKLLKLGTTYQNFGTYGSTAALNPATNKNSTYFGTTSTGIINNETGNRFKITGATSQTAGASQSLTITYINPDGTTNTSYINDHTLTFSGAGLSPGGTAPTVKDKNGTATNFGSSTTITFTNGVATVSGSNNGVMALYKAETALISVTDGTYSSTGAENLTVTVSAATYGLYFTTQPGGTTQVDDLFTSQPVVTVQDVYGNINSGTARNITLAIGTNPGSGILGGTTTAAVNTSTAQAPFTDLSINKAGTGYTLVASSSGLSNGTSSPFDISNPAPTLDAISPSQICAGGGDFTLTVSGTNFNSQSVVKINGSVRTTSCLNSTLLTATILSSDIGSAGTPSITVINPAPGGGNSSSATLTVSLVSFTPTVTQPSCFSLGKITLGTITGGTAPYIYEWTDLPGATSVKDRVGLGAGTYTVTVTDANGCSASYTSPALVAATGCAGIEVCQSDAASVITTDPDPANTSYTWTVKTVPAGAIITGPTITTVPSITINWTGVPVGQYQVCVTGNNTCGTSTQTCRDVYVKKPDVSAYADPVCSGGILNLYASGGVSYSWTGPNSFISNTQNPVIYNATSANSGTYTVSVTDANGCIATTTVAVSITAPPTTFSGIPSSTSACGALDGSIDLTVSPTPVSYQWSTGETTEDIAGLGAGNYIVDVYYTATCFVSKEFSVNDGSSHTVALTSTPCSCIGGSDGTATATVTGGTANFTYTWSDTNNSTTTTSSRTNTITGLPAGDYDVTVTDNGGICTAVGNVTVTEPSAPVQVLNSVVTNVNCFGNSTGSIVQTVSGGNPAYTYSWKKNSVSYGGNTKDLSSLTAGVYEVTITDSKGCTPLIKTYTVTQPSAALNASATTTDVSCFSGSNGTVNLTVTGGTSPYTFAWTKSGGGFSASTQDLTGLSAATYNVTITDAKSCPTATVSATIGQPAVISVTNIAQTTIACNGGTATVTITATGGTSPYSYTFDGVTNTTGIFTHIAGTALAYSVTDSRSCTPATGIFTVNQPTLLTASISAQTNVSCNAGTNGTAIAQGTGGTSGYTYSWNTLPVQNTQTATGLAAGTYIVTVTDAGLCTAQSFVTITQPDAMNVTGFPTNVSCNSGNDGAINVVVAGGTSPYTYDWADIGTPGSFTDPEDRSGLSAATYTVIVKDANGCQVTKSFLVTQPNALTASAVATSSTCNGANNGSINLTVGGGTAPFTYAWSNSASTEDISGLAPGTFTVTVTDALNCTQTASATVSEPDVLTLSGVVKDNCSSQSNGQITLTTTGGTSTYQYSQDGGAYQSGNVFSGLAAGTYAVTVKDANNCTASANFTLAVMTASLTPYTVSCIYFGTSDYGVIGDGEIYTTITNGTAPFTFAWTASDHGVIPAGQSTNQNITGLTWGTYQVVVSDGNGCTYTVSTTLAAPTCQPPVANPDFYTSCAASVTGSVATNDGTGNYTLGDLTFLPMSTLTADQGTIVWDPSYNGAFTFTPAAGYTGTVVLDYQVSNPIDLTATGTLTIYVSSMAAQVTAGNTSHVSCGATNGTSMVTATGGFAPYTYSWNTSPVQTDATATGLSAGTYMVRVTDAKGCYVDATVTIQNICLTISKTLKSINGNTSATEYNAAGDVIAYDIVVTNTGTATLTKCGNN